jgi:hypothetical protein
MEEKESSCKRPNKNLWLEQRRVMHKYLATIFEKLIEENQILECDGRSNNSYTKNRKH